MRFGIDLGGTKIELIAINDSGDEVYRKRVNTPNGSYPGTLTALQKLVQEAETQLAVSGTVGIGIPGSLSKKTGRVKNANSTWLIGEDLQGDLAKLLNRPVRLANDANCFTLSEASDGAAAGQEVVFGVIIGTGCGGGIVANGQIINGINSISGEWGHNPLPWQASSQKHSNLTSQAVEACYCGLTDCNETFLSGTGFSKRFNEANQAVFSEKLTAKQIVERSKLNTDPGLIAQQALEDYCVWLAKGLASVINLLDPDVIVLGGGMSNIELLYQRVPEIWQNWVFSDQVETRLLPPKWGDSSGVRGAAWLWPV